MRAEKIQIPATIEEAVTALGGLGKLLTAKGWERSAIVYAFTERPGQGNRSGSRGTSSGVTKLSPEKFADLGIHGLRSPLTVREHHANWEEAIANGWATEVKPGDAIILPSEGYPPTTRVPAWSDDAPVESKVKLARKLKEDPEVEQALERDFVEKAAKDPGLAFKVEHAFQEQNPTPIPPAAPTGDIYQLKVNGFGANILSFIERQDEEHRAIVDYLRDRRDDFDPGTRKGIETMIGRLGEARAVLIRYEDDFAAALGVSVDETFQRLINS